jgi:hypothetical protein
MFYDDSIKEYGDINYNINKQYCEKYNLEIILSNEKKYTDRHPAWERLPTMLAHIEKYDYLIWIDADAFFYVDAKNIVDIINRNKNVNFIFSNDINNNNINTGVFIVKNSQYSIDFLNKWAYDDELYINNPHPYWWDQGVLIGMIEKNILDIKDNYISYDYGILQHFFKYELKVIEKPFIFHLAGRDTNERITICKEYFNKFL